MDGKTLARIGAIVFVAVAIVAAVIDMNRHDNPQVGLAPPGRLIIDRDPLDAELARCSGLGEAGPRDPSCLRVWAESRRRHGGGGPYLCGALSIADAFYAPVAFRFQTYRVAPAGEAGAYLASLLAHPFMREWERDAVAESIVIEADEPRFVYRDKLAGRA